MGLLCLWWAFGQKYHWSVRAIPVIASVWATLLVPAYECGIVGMLQCLIVLLAACLFGKHRFRQFRLKELLLAIVVTAAFLGYLIRIPTAIWHKPLALLWFGTGFGLLTLLAAHVSSQERIRKRWWIVGLASPAFVVMLAWLCTRRVSEESQSSQLRRIARKVRTALLTTIIVLPVVAAWYSLARKSPIPVENAPQENCLPHLLTIGERISPKLFQPFPTKADALKTAVTQSQSAREEVRSSMAKAGWLGVNYHPGDPTLWWTSRRDSIGQICFAFLAEAELAETENRISDALTSYHDILKFVDRSARGGLPREATLAGEIEGDALGRVFQLRQKMDSKQCKEWIQLLSAHRNMLESTDTVMRRRYAWVDQVACWQDRLATYWHRLFSRELNGREMMNRLAIDRQLRISLLRTELALRRYFLDHQEYPDSLSKLVPAYIEHIPRDPYAEQNLTYRQSDEKFLLYSVGRDGQDDEGRLADGSYFYEPGDIPSRVLVKWCMMK